MTKDNTRLHFDAMETWDFFVFKMILTSFHEGDECTLRNAKCKLFLKFLRPI